MKSIQPVHTLRISAQLHELKIGQAEKLCAIPYQYEQRTITEFLRAICEPLPRAPGVATVVDPAMWSVNERMNVIIFYLAAMLDDGPDFKLGAGNLHDYLLAGTDYVESVTFLDGTEEMVCTPLHGYQAEVIEQLVLTGSLPKTYFGWQLGVMSACARGIAETPIEYRDPASYSKALLERIERLREAPETDFVRFYEAFSEAALRLQHFVHAVFYADGVVAAQVSEPDAEKGVPMLGPARFHPRIGISARACAILEATDQHQG